MIPHTSYVMTCSRGMNSDMSSTSFWYMISHRKSQENGALRRAAHE